MLRTNFKRDTPLSNNTYIVEQQWIINNYWLLAELLVTTCWFGGICGWEVDDGDVANRCFMGFGAHQPIQHMSCTRSVMIA